MLDRIIHLVEPFIIQYGTEIVIVLCILVVMALVFAFLFDGGW